MFVSMSGGWWRLLLARALLVEFGPSRPEQFLLLPQELLLRQPGLLELRLFLFAGLLLVNVSII